MIAGRFGLIARAAAGYPPRVMSVPRSHLLAAAAALLLAVAPSSAPACPSCKSTLSGQEMVDEAKLQLEIAAMTEGMNSPEAQRALAHVEEAEGEVMRTRGYFWSILMMMAAPFTLFGILGFAMTRAFRRAAAARDLALAAHDESLGSRA